MVESLAPFVPSQEDVVKKMLEVAGVVKDDIIFDLGCGDGRILITAVKDFNVKKAVGYEMRLDLYQQTMKEIEKMNLNDRIQIINEDLLKANIQDANIITLYLTTSGNEKLRPKLEKEAKKGTRIISHDFDFIDWNPIKKESYFSHSLYLYKIPDSIIKKSEKKGFDFKRLNPF